MSTIEVDRHNSPDSLRTMQEYKSTEQVIHDLELITPDNGREVLLDDLPPKGHEIHHLMMSP